MKPRIFFVATAESTIHAFLISHLRSLSSRYEVTLLVNTSNPYFLKKYGLKIKVIPINILRKINFFSDLLCVITLIKIFYKAQPNAVHSITPKAGLLAMLAAYLVCTPLRIHTFTGQVWANKKGLTRLLLKMIDFSIARLSTFNIVDSSSQQKFLIKNNILNKNKSIVFGSGSVSGVDLSKFMPNKKSFFNVRSSLSIPFDAFIFIFIGRLNSDKGVLDLAQAFAKLQDKSVYLLVVGPDEGNFAAQIQKINKHKLNQLRFVTWTKSPELYLAASNILCLPSHREGFGNVIIEAAATQIPAIASNIYGISDAIINHQTGILHPVEDVDAIARAMQYFLNNPHMVLKFGKVARKRAIAKFDSKKITAFWIEFYSRIFKNAQKIFI